MRLTLALSFSQAWAARFTDHVSVIGSNGPTLAELRTGVGRDFTMIGKLREGFARGILQRAIETVDRRAGLRTASTACCSALVLLEFLVTCQSLVMTTHFRPFRSPPATLSRGRRGAQI